MELTLAGAAERLNAADRILILSHHFPDGDTLGSASALCRALRKLGKTVSFRCSDTIPGKFTFLFDGLEDVFYPLPEGFTPDLIASVDVADMELLGALREEYEGKVDLSIDHHGSHRAFAKWTCVDARAAACAEILFRLIPLLGVTFDRKMAACIYTGITTDTGCFRYRNTTADSLRIAAEMMEYGIDAAEINFRMFETKTRARLEMERLVLDSAEFFCGGKAVMMAVTQEMIAKTGAKDEDLDGISAIPRRVEGVLAGITMREKEDGNFKVSVRSNPPVSACEICAVLGGGGHPGAAGCTVEGPFASACRTVRKVVEQYMEKLSCSTAAH